MGSEEDGVSPEFLKMSDIKAKIPMNGKISSLNVSVASAIIVYESYKTKRNLTINLQYYLINNIISFL